MTTPRRRMRTQARSQEPSEDTQGQTMEVPVRWVGMDNLPVLMANMIFVRYIHGQIVITFGQAIPPYEHPISKETVERLRREGGPVQAVARVSVSPLRLGRMVDALSEIQGRLSELTTQETRIEAGAES